MTKILDLRQTDPDDSDRQRRRQQIREQAARRDLELQPALVWEADIRASQARCDAAADRHATATAPWQSELKDLEARAIARIGRREEPDADEDQRRAELIGLIAEATRDLETTVNREREIQAALSHKANRLRMGHPSGYTILGALAQPPLASPALLVKLHVAQQRTAAATGRIARAQAALKIAEYNLDGVRRGVISGELSVYEHKKACWEAELEAAQREQADAQREGEAIHRAMIDE